MRHIAIVYSTKFGQTTKIVFHMKKAFEEAGCVATVHNLNKRLPFLDQSIDTVVYGGPLYAGRLPYELSQWVVQNFAALKIRKSGFFMVCLNAADKRPEARTAEVKIVQGFLKDCGAQPDVTGVFAGALMNSRYFYLLRLVMRRIARKAGALTDLDKNYEYTEWEKVDEFVDQIICLEPNDRKNYQSLTPSKTADADWKLNV